MNNGFILFTGEAFFNFYIIRKKRIMKRLKMGIPI